MAIKETIGVGVIGFGNVGSGVVELLLSGRYGGLEIDRLPAVKRRTKVFHVLD